VRATQRLIARGFEAYLVGGCVRDLLLDRTPKDYDIATEARPPQCKRTFPRNCRIIGRRFKLAHLHFNNNTKILEVSTFRRSPPAESGNGETDLLITHDNEFGTAEEDALRRDFTVNALFLDPTRDVIIDYTNGLADLRARVIRTIGDPRVRFREDPVRILRAAKFAGRLGFTIEPETFAAMAETSGDLVRSAPPRLLEEILRLLRGGHALDSFQLLRDVGALKCLVPVLAEFLATARHAQRVEFWRLLEALDHQVLDTGRVPQNGILLGALLVCPVLAKAAANPGRSPSSIAEELLGPLSQSLRLPRRDAGCLKRICGVQHRFTQPDSMKRFRLAGFVHGPYFEEAFELFALRMSALGDDADVERWHEIADRLGRHAPADGDFSEEQFHDEGDADSGEVPEPAEPEPDDLPAEDRPAEGLAEDGHAEDAPHPEESAVRSSADGEPEPESGAGRRKRRRRRRGRGRDNDTALEVASDVGPEAESSPGMPDAAHSEAPRVADASSDRVPSGGVSSDKTDGAQEAAEPGQADSDGARAPKRRSRRRGRKDTVRDDARPPAGEVEAHGEADLPEVPIPDEVVGDLADSDLGPMEIAIETDGEEADESANDSEGAAGRGESAEGTPDGDGQRRRRRRRRRRRGNRDNNAEGRFPASDVPAPHGEGTDADSALHEPLPQHDVQPDPDAPELGDFEGDDSPEGAEDGAGLPGAGGDARPEGEDGERRGRRRRRRGRRGRNRDEERTEGGPQPQQRTDAGREDPAATAEHPSQQAPRQGRPQQQGQQQQGQQPQRGDRQPQGQRQQGQRPQGHQQQGRQPEGRQQQQGNRQGDNQGQPQKQSQPQRQPQQQGGRDRHERRDGRREDRGEGRNGGNRQGGRGGNRNGGHGHGSPRDVDVVPRYRDRRGKVDVIEPAALDLTAFDVELDPKRVPTFGSIVEGKGRPKKRAPKVPEDGIDDYRPPPPPGSDSGPTAPPPPPPNDSPDTFGDW